MRSLINSLHLLKTIRRRTPLGWLQLKHDRMRLLTAISGIAFADILIFMQFGFMDALYKTNTQYPRHLKADLILTSTQATHFNKLSTFPRRRLYQAMDVNGVESADALYVGSLDWRNPQTRVKTSMMVLGQDPNRSTFNLPQINQQLNLIKLPNTVLFDQASRGDYQAVVAAVEQGKPISTEVGRRTIQIGGLFTLGASFSDDGALITSNQNFLRLFPKREAGVINMGVIDIKPNYLPEQVSAALNAYLPEDVTVRTYEEYLDFELAYIQRRTPIGFVFTLGSAMGFVVGVVIVYQVLSTDVNAHMAEYATFKAMGYRNSYLLGVVFEEAIILAGLGFFPSVAIALGLYRLTAMATALPLSLPIARALWVLALTILMCGLSGAISTRRLQSADPADIF